MTEIAFALLSILGCLLFIVVVAGCSVAAYLESKARQEVFLTLLRALEADSLREEP